MFCACSVSLLSHSLTYKKAAVVDSYSFCIAVCSLNKKTRFLYETVLH